MTTCRACRGDGAITKTRIVGVAGTAFNSKIMTQRKEEYSEQCKRCNGMGYIEEKIIPITVKKSKRRKECQDEAQTA